MSIINMKIMSLALEGAKLKPVEVELVLAPGIPQIHFLGLPDQVIKESIYRIKSAIRNQGFEFPKTKQILVNIRPAHIKKSSRGLELAVAAALIWETGQLPKPLAQKDYFVYGELGLSGDVFEPEDLSDFEAETGSVVLTGPAKGLLGWERHCVKTLRDLAHFDRVLPDRKITIVRPELGLEMRFPPEQARLLEVLSLGEHHCLLAGPAGSGKSTLARALISFLSKPNDEEVFRRRLTWRPLVCPHHSISALSLIGGAVPPRPGEITRAHGGILVMDELLEFSPAAQESLREPLEEGLVRISRGLRSETFPSRFMLVATTNLCPCGQWVPGQEISCRFSRVRCSSYQQRLSGPFLDRFEILSFVQKAKGGEFDRRLKGGVSGVTILERIEDIRDWQKNRSYLKDSDHRFQPFIREHIWPKEFSSMRRERAMKKVALTLADLDKSEFVQAHHVEESVKLTINPFQRVARGM